MRKTSKLEISLMRPLRIDPDFLLNGHPHDPVVYFIRIGNVVKIGTSVNIRVRLQSLALLPSNIKLLVPGGMEIERAYHNRFARLRIQGEWFKNEGRLADFLTIYQLSGSDTFPEDYTELMALKQIAQKRIVPMAYSALVKARQRDPDFPIGFPAAGGKVYPPELIIKWYKERRK